MVQCNSVADRNQIWAKKRLLKDSKKYISEDLPKEMDKRRAQLVPIMKKARTINAYKESTYLVGDKLVINKVKYTIDKIDELPHDLNPRTTATQSLNDMTLFYTKYSPFSNHFMESPFRMVDTIYSCTEQRYFVAKAEYLGDDEAIEGIMAAIEPHEILTAGKKITNRNGKDWSNEEVHAMTEANRHKYNQNSGVRTALLATENTRLFECSPYDDHWGTGVSIDDMGKTNEQLLGTNLMGQVLSTIRLELQLQLQKKEADRQKLLQLQFQPESGVIMEQN
jgi:hypothetical protein